MAFVLPNPLVPTNGQPGNATPILQNELAIAQAIAAFDGSQINAGSVPASALAANANPQTRGLETTANFVYTGCIWSLVSVFSGTMTGGTIYVNGIRVVVSGIGANTFAASSDTYVYIDSLGNVTYSAVSNNAASPSATANAILVAIVITNGSTITSVNQGAVTAVAPIVASNTLTVCDSLGNLIYPTDPASKLLGYRQVTSTLTNISTSNTAVAITGLSVPVIVPTGRKIKISVYIKELTTSAITTPVVSIYDGAVPAGTLIQDCDGATMATSAYVQSLYGEAPLVIPSTNSKTYNAGIRNTASANVSITAEAAAVSTMKVELY